MKEPNEPVEMPPEGASCAEHPERDALVTCPRCGSYCCLACWHSAVRRCHSCVLRDPGPPVPWEDPDRGLLGRFVRTMGDAFRPTRSAPSFARSRWRSGISFALVSFVPLALLSGIIPYTHMLVFGAGQVHVVGDPASEALALDVGRAALLGLVIATFKLLCIALPYYSLARAYGSRGNPTAPLSAVLYRGWLIPFAYMVLHVLIFMMPAAELTDGAKALLQVAHLLPLIVLISSLLATARMASGVGPIAALFVVLVPFFLMMVLDQMAMHALQPWMPDPELARQAAGVV